MSKNREGEDPRPFVCPECKMRYLSYWYGSDCGGCGKIHLCKRCGVRHDKGLHQVDISIEFLIEGK